jgi:hypothetical protein
MRKKLEERMDPVQYRVYLRERFEILARIRDRTMGLMDWQNGEAACSIPTARVPLIFADEQTGAGDKPKGYLPVVTRYLFNKGTMHLRVLYLEVSACLQKDPAGHWVCNL